MLLIDFAASLKLQGGGLILVIEDELVLMNSVLSFIYIFPYACLESVKANAISFECVSLIAKSYGHRLKLTAYQNLACFSHLLWPMCLWALHNYNSRSNNVNATPRACRRCPYSCLTRRRCPPVCGRSQRPLMATRLRRTPAAGRLTCVGYWSVPNTSCTARPERPPAAGELRSVMARGPRGVRGGGETGGSGVG